MTSGSKRRLKQFENYYKKGELQQQFVDRMKHNYEVVKEESGVLNSWFEYCEDKYGKIEQPNLTK